MWLFVAFAPNCRIKTAVSCFYAELLNQTKMKVDKEALIVNLIVIGLGIFVAWFLWFKFHEPETTEENYTYIYSDDEI